MTTYTKAEIRGAILRAADRVERNPSSYQFSCGSVPDRDDGCGTTACMWGWIGYELQMHGRINADVARACGAATPTDSVCETGHLYQFCLAQDDFDAVPRNLRAYADKYFPAEVAAQANDCRALVRWEDCVWRPAQVRA